MYHNGKIANLPEDLIEELNCRLDAGIPGPQILSWLNAQKETRKVLKNHFDGVPISKQNLSQWRNGGYQEWRVRSDFEHHISRACNNHYRVREETAVNLVANYLAAEVAALYAKFLATWDGQPSQKVETQLRVLRGLNKDIALLQKTMERADNHIKAYAEAQEKERQDIAEAHLFRTHMKSFRENQSNQVKPETPVKPKEEETPQETDTEEFTPENESTHTVQLADPIEPEIPQDQPEEQSITSNGS